jgi:hypothetical protein
VEALEARHAALDIEVVERSRARDEVALMLAEARAREASDAYIADLDAGGPSRRRRRRVVRVALGIVVALVAVVGIRAGYRNRPHYSSDRDAIYLRFAAFTGEMCTCTTSTCASRVADEMTKWGTALAQQTKPGDEQMSEHELQRFMKLAERMASCQSALPGS